MVSNIWLPSDRHNDATHHALIYYVCGNPGLIEYYTDFLKLLRGLLDKVENDTAYDIYGRNLFGFVDDEHESSGPENQLWDLNGQIEGIYDDVAARRVDSKPYDFVILMGHSVGSYICVEIFHRHLESPERAPHLNLRHGFLLFPTLTHIARSNSGLKFTALRRAVPFLDTTTHIIARLLFSFLTVAGLTWLVQRVMGFTPLAASVTARWLKSRNGRDGVKNSGPQAKDQKGDAPRFFVFYAKSDHWVDDGEREGFIERRRGGVTRIEVDEGDIPHAFCTRDDASLEVARRVCGWVEEIDRVGENH
ncbi:hypothetical protein CEP52_005001 [Fusarium oligoseptatum]|uniref:Lipid droplet-associated hydrolase n=1 Tax=Fusarium oligoseptatum TaxID=2604345 RepID=A0A428U0K1_9HYPO|nr:hypothetical protein CEP52_005001 [Fusarium oligoseptatum]